VLANGTRDLVVGPRETRELLAAFHVGTMSKALPLEERIRLVFGLPRAPFRARVLEQLHDERVNSELRRLEDSIDNLDENMPNVPNLLESISDWTEVPGLDEGSSREEVDRAERQTREIARHRIQALNDVSRAMRNAASKLEQVDEPPAVSSQIPSQFNNEHELSLFGNRSVFDQTAQRGALSALEREILDAEREWRHKTRAVSGLLGSESAGESPSQGKGKGKQTARAVTVEDAEE
jgi:E3 ubiquitin-protein ligase synoviolin